MLKLLKYEWKACARACLPLYGAIILVALINHLLYSEAVPELLFGIPAAIMSMLYVVIFAAVFVATAVILVQRFYKSLLGGEGYLMFTLPVSVTQHIFSKAIIAVAMCFLSCLVAFLSILLLSHGINPATFSFFDPAAVPYVLEGLLWLVLCAFAAVLFIYLCIALGHLAKKHRLLMAFVWYFVLSTAVQIIGMLVLMAGGNAVSESMARSIGQFWASMGSGAVHFVVLILCLVSATAAAVCFAGTRYILTHKLNLRISPYEGQTRNFSADTAVRRWRRKRPVLGREEGRLRRPGVPVFTGENAAVWRRRQKGARAPYGSLAPS